MNEEQHISDLKNHFLIAMPGLQDPYFMHSVVYIHEHSDTGATGFIVNKPTNVKIAEILERVELASDDEALTERPTLLGGPVSQEQIYLMMHDKDNLTPQTIKVSYSPETLAEVVNPESKQEALFFLGYASWEPGQLENEIANNGWLIVPYSNDILFDLPYVNRYEAAASLIGVDIANLSGDVGHA